jgi:predicted ATPase/signal transduction histidine kinase
MVEISKYLFEYLLTDGEFNLYRGRGTEDLRSILVVAPVLRRPDREAVRRLEHEYSLLEGLELDCTLKPLRLIHDEGRIMLVFEDPGSGVFGLDRWLGQPMDLGRFLRIGINLAVGLGELHRQGLIHKDIKPDHILVDTVTDKVWFTGFGIASQLPREHQVLEPPEVIAGTLAYMAPEQTGRMNRSIDSRSDLYSLGITFYQMLTGSLPFVASEPIEWIHSHIARSPVPPHERIPEIPEPISALVLKLLAKTAEERYQTAVGLETDLRKCLLEWNSTGRIEPFAVAQQDVPDRLLIPEKLYGREQECRTLLQAFDRVVASGKPELVLVSGYSGIGKSSLVQELYKVIVLPRGIFVSGKFDQNKRGVPYATLAQAFRTLVSQILSMREEEVIRWRNLIVEALGSYGQLMVNLIPELELVIGKQPAVPHLPPQAAQSRFEAVWRRFLGVFARKEHPLALFIDDLQWLDPETLRLIEQFLTHSQIEFLLLVGAYRENEVTANHPLRLTLQATRAGGAAIHEIALQPLSLRDTEELLGDALHCEPSSTRQLAALVHDKTRGNPFFTIQFLITLADEELLKYEAREAAWRWDLKGIRAKGFTDNVADLMIVKLRRLPNVTQEALKLLSCLGNTVKVSTILAAVDGAEGEMHSAFWEAVRAGLILRNDNSYQFLHDRVREAAYALIPEKERPEFHLCIGRRLLTRMSPDEVVENIFDIVNQFNLGGSLIYDRDDKTRVAELNLEAGRKAKTTAAYASAGGFFSLGIALLGDWGWETQPKLAFDLRYEMAECEFIGANFAETRRLISELLSRGKSKIDRAAAYRLKMQLHMVESALLEAIQTGLECLQMFDVVMRVEPTRQDVQIEYDKVWLNLGVRPIESLIDLPLMTNSEMQTVMSVLRIFFRPAYLVDTNLTQLIVCYMVNISLTHGTTEASAHGYVGFGLFLGPVFHRYHDGDRFAELAMRLIEKHQFSAWTSDTYLMSQMVVVWTRPLTVAVEFLRTSFRAAVESGDVVLACYSLEHMVTDMLARGDNLDQLWLESEKALDSAQKAKFLQVVNVLTSTQGFIQSMRGGNVSISGFADEEIKAALERGEGSPPVAICFDLILKLQTYFMAGQYEAAVAMVREIEPLLWSAQCHIQAADYYYYAALAIAAMIGPSSSEPRRSAESLKRYLTKLSEWAEIYAPTFFDKYALVSAEIARIEGRDLEAMRLYEDAILSARKHGFIQNEAISYEVAAQFYLDRGYETIAQTYLRNAHQCYLRWGALGKVEQLEQKFSGVADRFSIGDPSSMDAPVDQLDLQTVVKISQAVSSEIVLEKLTQTLMRITVEHAGAERGLLILQQGEEYRIEAEAKVGPSGVEVRLQHAATSSSELPESLLRYVIRSQQSLILDDASSQSLFSQDPYVLEKRPKSVLCLPLVKRTDLIGALYLENKLAPRVFTPKRLALLQLLTSQATISLDHARLYAEAKRAEGLQAAMARQREIFAQQRVAQLVKANGALRGLLDELASVPQLDEFIGQVMAAITGQLGAVSSVLALLRPDGETMAPELMYQDGLVRPADEAEYPKHLVARNLDQITEACLQQAIRVLRLDDPLAMQIPGRPYAHLIAEGVKVLLIIPLSSKGQINGVLSFRFTDDRQFQEEELEIARTLATQASLAIQLTQLAGTARESAVLEERNRLASEIHDSLAQSFAGISMQLSAAGRALARKSKDAQQYVERANELARFGLSEARRSALSLRSNIIEESGLIEALRKLAERSNIPGLIRCSFQATRVDEKALSPQVQQDLLRIGQEAISNALRHAQPTEIRVSLRVNPPNLVLKVTDNGSGLAKSRGVSEGQGFGFANMRARAKNLGATLEVRSNPGHGTSVIVRLRQADSPRPDSPEARPDNQ